MSVVKQCKKTARNLLRKEQGTAAMEFAFILPILAVLIFAVVDFGRYIQARLVITNVSREGGNLASRDIKTGADLITMLQSSATPLILSGEVGRICITSIKAGGLVSGEVVEPFIDTTHEGGGLTIGCGTRTGVDQLGLSDNLYNHLVYNEDNKASDIGGVTVVEVYYKYKPLTPLPSFISGLFLSDGDGTIMGSKAVFCTTGDAS